MVILRIKGDGVKFAHFKDASVGKALNTLVRRWLKLDSEVIELPEKRYMDVDACVMHKRNSVQYGQEAMRIVEDFIYDDELRAQVHDLIQAARAKAIIETTMKIQTKCAHIRMDNYHLLNLDPDE